MRARVLINFPRIVHGVASCVLLSAMSAGCGGTAIEAPARAPKPEPVYIARPCAAMREQPIAAVPVGMILEVANVLEPVGKPAKDWLATHPVDARAVAKISLSTMAGTSAPSPFGLCSNRDCSETQDGSLGVTVSKAPADASAPIELLFALTTPNGDNRSLSLKTTDQEPVTASLAASPAQTIVVTPYYLYEPTQHGMQLLLNCASRTPSVPRSD